jgi:hypothetical protein
MLEKFEILIVIFVLLGMFYLVISLGARKGNKETISLEIKNYLFNVRILIAVIAVVSFILWLFI